MARKTKPFQYSFGAGELAPSLSTRRDTQQYSDGAKSLRNNRLLVGGGASRRPGSWWSVTLLGDARLQEFIVDDESRYILVFSNGRMDAYDALNDLAAAGSVTGCPWTTAQVHEMDVCGSANTIFIAHPDFAPQVITRTGASTWAIEPFTFYEDFGGRLNQPYYKLAPIDCTMTPSALSGTGITLTLSENWWTPDHVGARVRYHKRELLITGYTSATVVTATAIEALPSTSEMTVAAGSVSTSGASGELAVGQTVTGSITGAVGVVTSIPSTSTVRVTMLEKLTPTFSGSDSLVGPRGKVAITGFASATPGATRIWDEALYTEQNGYPRCVELHRNRLLFAGSASLPNGIASSRNDNLYTFEVGDASDSDGFLETIGDSGASQIVQLHSAEQLLIFTDRGPYYVPEASNNPFRPSSLAFNQFGGPWPCSTARTGDFDGGVIMVSGSLVIKCQPTGDTTRMWRADEVSLLSSHLLDAPTAACFTSNFAGGAERYGVFRNTDGTLAVMQSVEEQKLRSFVPWDTDGEYRSVAALDGDLYAVVLRTIDGDPIYTLEAFDTALTLDCAKEYADLDDVAADFGSTSVNVVVDNYHLGTLPLAGDEPPDGPYNVGLDYTRTIETLPPDIQDATGNHAGETMRIAEALVHVLESARFAVNGYEITAYQTTDDLGEAPPLRSGPIRFTFLGWSREPTITITQTDPLPLTVLGIKTKVVY